MGEQPATKFYPAKSGEQTKKSKQFVLPKITPMFSEPSHTEWRNHLIFHPEFPFFFSL